MRLRAAFRGVPGARRRTRRTPSSCRASSTRSRTRRSRIRSRCGSRCYGPDRVFDYAQHGGPKFSTGAASHGARARRARDRLGPEAAARQRHRACRALHLWRLCSARDRRSPCRRRASSRSSASSARSMSGGPSIRSASRADAGRHDRRPFDRAQPRDHDQGRARRAIELRRLSARADGPDAEATSKCTSLTPPRVPPVAAKWGFRPRHPHSRMRYSPRRACGSGTSRCATSSRTRSSKG